MFKLSIYSCSKNVAEWIDYAVKDSETLESSLDFDFSAADDCNKQTTGIDYQDRRKSRDLTRANNIAMVNRDKREPRVTLQNRVAVNEESTLAEKQLRLQNAFQIAQDIEQYRLLFKICSKFSFNFYTFSVHFWFSFATSAKF